MTLVTKRMKFKDSGSMNRFLLLYMDIFQFVKMVTVDIDIINKD